MDVKSGHCWRCEKTLPARSVSCDRCPKAVYCRDECKQRDKIRHGAVECKMFGLKTCIHCNKTGYFMQCSGCNDAWYCDAACQRENWTVHKKTCKDIQAAIKVLALKMTSRHALHAQTDDHDDLPEINFSATTMAHDFLKLEDNEWAGIPGGETSERELTHDYHILFAGCGDLKNTVLTTASLPAEYQGKLHITMNDSDTFGMARNVLFLFMLRKFAHDDRLAPSLATIWFSLHISEADYCLIQTSLQSLLKATSKSLRDLSGGLVHVSVSDKDLTSLRDIWIGWLHLQCERKHRLSINLRKQWQAGVTHADLTLNQEHLKKLSLKEAASVMEWFQHSIFTPDGMKQEDLTFDNPTLTAATDENHAFMYSHFNAGEPLSEWDSLQVKEYAKDRPSCSIIAMYHAYVTHLLEEMKHLHIQKRLHITILVSSFTEIPQHHQTLKLGNYDRIFTSNLADYVGIPTLLKTLKPLLNITNKNAMMVTQIMRWLHDMPQHYIRLQKIKELHQQDTGINISSNWWDLRYPFEYHYNIPFFIAYLRAHMMAGSHLVPSPDRVPSFKEAMQCEGMQMRDFRQELNKLVPFKYRVNARMLTFLTGDERTIE